MNDLREGIVAAHHSISPSFYSKKDYSQVENIQDRCLDPKSDCAREKLQKISRATAQMLQVLVSVFNVKFVCKV